MENIKLYTIKEVQDILRVTRRTLYSCIKDGRLHAIKVGRYWRVPEESLRLFLTGKKDQTPHEATTANILQQD